MHRILQVSGFAGAEGERERGRDSEEACACVHHGVRVHVCVRKSVHALCVHVPCVTVCRACEGGREP